MIIMYRFSNRIVSYMDTQSRQNSVFVISDETFSPAIFDNRILLGYF